MEGTGGQRGRGQARSKADRLKKKLQKWFVAAVFQNSLHFEVSSEGVMIAFIWKYWSNAKVPFQ